MKYLIAGLGNIGAEYEHTRHNAGFEVADALVSDLNGRFEPARYGNVARVRFRARTLLVLKPSTYMNLSGKAIRYWLNKEQIPTENLLVIVDDLALPAGMLRLRAKGGDGGHNGLISIISELGTASFARLRVGIGNNFGPGRQVDYVLGQWEPEEWEALKQKLPRAVEIIKSFVAIGVHRTMNRFNTLEGKSSENNQLPSGTNGKNNV